MQHPDAFTLKEGETPYGIYRQNKFLQLTDDSGFMDHNNPKLGGMFAKYELGAKATVLDLARLTVRRDDIASHGFIKSALPVKLIFCHTAEVRYFPPKGVKIVKIVH